jgi:hypothetical protein
MSSQIGWSDGLRVTCMARGHEIYFDQSVRLWRYCSDDGAVYDASHDRPCIRCGSLPTPEGYDHCLGHIRGAKSACCGHGVGKAFVMYHRNKHINVVMKRLWLIIGWIVSKCPHGAKVNKLYPYDAEGNK